MGKELEKGKVSTIRGRSPSADGSAAEPPPAALPTPPATATVGRGKAGRTKASLARQSMKMLWKLTDNIKYEECEVSASPGPGQSPGPAAASGSLQHPSVSQFRLGKLLLRRQASLRSCSRRGAGVLPQELRGLWKHGFVGSV